jgi:hypothetical protein
MATSFLGALIYSQKTFAFSGMRNRAVFLAEEGLEATRNIRDAAFTNLVNGSYGLAIVLNQWTLGSAPDNTENTFYRTITISTIDSNTKNIVSSVLFTDNFGKSQTVSLSSYLTNWQAPMISTCSQYCISLGIPAYTAGTCRRNNGACVTNSETRQIGGNIYCTVSPNTTCCCKP